MTGGMALFSTQYTRKKLSTRWPTDAVPGHVVHRRCRIDEQAVLRNTSRVHAFGRRLGRSRTSRDQCQPSPPATRRGRCGARCQKPLGRRRPSVCNHQYHCRPLARQPRSHAERLGRAAVKQWCPPSSHFSSSASHLAARHTDQAHAVPRSQHPPAICLSPCGCCRNRIPCQWAPGYFVAPGSRVQAWQAQIQPQGVLLRSRGCRLAWIVGTPAKHGALIPSRTADPLRAHAVPRRHEETASHASTKLHLGCTQQRWSGVESRRVEVVEPGFRHWLTDAAVAGIMVALHGPESRDTGCDAHVPRRPHGEPQRVVGLLPMAGTALLVGFLSGNVNAQVRLVALVSIRYTHPQHTTCP